MSTSLGPTYPPPANRSRYPLFAEDDEMALQPASLAETAVRAPLSLRPESQPEPEPTTDIDGAWLTTLGLGLAAMVALLIIGVLLLLS